MTDIRTAPSVSESPAEGQPAASRFRRSVPVLSMIGLVVLGAVIPLVRNPNFYYWDDTAGVAIGVWQRIAGQLLSGHLPFLQLDMWRGGNFIAEAATGMWNPVMVFLMLATHPFDDIATAITIAKLAFFIIMACGVFVLARGYRANLWMSALAGVVMPLSGWALFMNGTSWINEIAITAFAPWAWWAIRRTFLKEGTTGSIIIAVICGYLLVSVGDPYGLLALAMIFVAVLIEAIATKRLGRSWWVVGMGVALVLMSVVIYLPFVLTSSVGFRADSSTYNTEFLSPNLSDLLGMSMPVFKPYVTAFGLPYMTFPGMYLAWFLLPMLPWLRWRSLGSHWRSLAGVLGFGVVYLLFVLGPTQIGMFRWPARLIPFLYLPILIVFVVVATRGLHRDRRTVRALLSLVAVAAGTWMAFSDMPNLWKWQALTTVIIVVLGWLFLRFGNVHGRGFVVLAGGLVLFVCAQVAIAPGNGNVANYNLPRSRSDMVQRFDGRYVGNTVQVADYMALPTRKLAPDEVWKDMLAGNMYSVAGVESTTAYSGIGYTKLDNALCLGYNGSTCPKAWTALWKTPPGGTEPLADLLRAQTVVVEKNFAEDTKAPYGWTRVETTPNVSVYRRDKPLMFPAGRVSAHGSDIRITSDVVHPDNSETMRVSASNGDTSITFARLAWPGYSASVNGKNVPVHAGPDGLLSVVVPGGQSGELTLKFTPPGLYVGLISWLLGAFIIVGLIIWRRRWHVNPDSRDDH